MDIWLNMNMCYFVTDFWQVFLLFTTWTKTWRQSDVTTWQATRKWRPVLTKLLLRARPNQNSRPRRLKISLYTDSCFVVWCFPASATTASLWPECFCSFQEQIIVGLLVPVMKLPPLQHTKNSGYPIIKVRPDSVHSDFGALQIIYLLTYLLIWAVVNQLLFVVVLASYAREQRPPTTLLWSTQTKPVTISLFWWSLTMPFL